MNLITKENAARNVFEDGYTLKVETSVTKGSDEKVTIEYDLSQMDVERVARAAVKDWLTDTRNNSNADVKRASDKGETITFKEALANRCVYDEARNVYTVRVKDLISRVRSVGVTKSVKKQAEEMTPEKLAATIAEMQAMLEAKLKAQS